MSDNRAIDDLMAIKDKKITELEAKIIELNITINADIQEIANANERIAKLKADNTDALDTILAMCLAAREEPLVPYDIDILEEEMRLVSNKPSEYITYILSTKNEEITELRRQIEAMKCYSTCANSTECEKADINQVSYDVCKGCLDYAYRGNWPPKGGEGG